MRTARAMALVLAFVSCAACRSANAGGGAQKTQQPFWTEGSHQGAQAAAPSPVQTFAPLVERLKPAVVNVYTTKKFKPRVRGRGLDPFEGDPFGDLFKDFFGREFQMPEPKTPREQRALGSGFIVSRDGYVLTNNHVVDGADEVKVRLADEREFHAEVVGRDAKLDVALLRLKDAKDLPSVTMGDSDRLKVGDWVVAIGNPFGLGHTVTAGIVSAKDRIIGAGPYDDFIQTDASINPGNSGGLLFDLRGEVVGINTAMHAGGQGIGFAIPVNVAKSALVQLRDKGKVTRGWLGVGIQHVTDELAKQFSLPQAYGALVTQVYAESPAARAGLKVGDVIVGFGGHKIERSEQLPRLVAETVPGTKVKLGILREGKPRDLTAETAEWNDKVEALTGSAAAAEKLGLSVRSGKDGVVVDEVDPSGAASSVLRPGDVIVEVNRKPVHSAADWNQRVAEVHSGDIVLLRVRRENATLFLTLQAP